MFARLQPKSRPATHERQRKSGAVAQRAAADAQATDAHALPAHALPAHETVAEYARSHASGLARAAAAPNRTGLPDKLKSGIEALSSISFDDVRVHRNSARPRQLQALAHSQGSDIHLGPGQERHLPHEAWHVAQQKQGRVRPTRWLRGTAINDDAELEREADTMGSRALLTAGRQAAPREMAGTGDVAQRVTVKVPRRQKLIKDQPPGQLHGQESAWDSKFDLDVVGKTIVVTIKIKAVISAELFQQIWAKQVAGQWSDRFAIKYNGETYPIIVKLEQVDKGHHYDVKVVDSKSVYGHGKRGHFGTQNMLEWGAHDVTNVSHEVGHMLGNPDEYGVVEANGQTIDYLANPSDTIMGKPANNPVAAHYELIRQTAQAELRRIKGNNQDATIVAHMGGRLEMSQLGFNPSQALSVKLSSSSYSKPKQEESESELSRHFAKMASTPSRLESISNSNNSNSSPSYSTSTSPSLSIVKPQSIGSSNSSKLQPQSSKSGMTPSKVESVSNSNVRKPTKEERDIQEMESNLAKAKLKAKEHPGSWVVERLVTYIENTIEQYKRNESREWCVRATGGFLMDIDQAIKEKHGEGRRPDFMDT